MTALNDGRSRLVGQTLNWSSGLEQKGSWLRTSASILAAGAMASADTSSACSASSKSCSVVSRCWPSMIVRVCIRPMGFWTCCRTTAPRKCGW